MKGTWLVLSMLVMLNPPCLASDALDVEEKLDRCMVVRESCMEKLEATFLALPGARATRAGTTLYIQTKAGTILFQDQPDAESQTVIHTYLGLLGRIGYHLVHWGLWEGDGFILISDASGEQTAVSAIPRVSPSGARFASVSAGEAYNPNEIAIWAITPEKLEQEFQFEPEIYALYEFLSWIGDQTLHVESVRHSDPSLCPNSFFMVVPETLHFMDGKWAMSMNPRSEIKCQ